MSFSRFLATFLLCIWVASFFGYLGWKPGFAYNAQRYFEIFLLGCLFCAGIMLPVRFCWHRFWAVACFTLLTVMVLVIWQAENHWLAVREGLQYLALFSAILLVAKVRHRAGSSSFDRAAYIGLVLFCFGCSLIVVEGLLLSISVGNLDPGVVFGAFVNVRIFAELQFLTLFLLPAAWLKMKSVGWRWFILLTAILWWGLLLFTGTRSALVALPFALLVLGLSGGLKTLDWLKVLAMQFAGGFLFFVFLRVGIAGILGSSLLGEGSMSFARSSSSGRLEIWADAWHHFVANPLLGTGPGSFACFTDGLAASPHNLLFQLLSEWGISVTILCFGLALLIFVALVNSMRSANPSNPSNPLQLSLFATLVTVVTASMMEGMITGPLEQMLIVLVLGWAWHFFAQNNFTDLDGKALRRYQTKYLVVLLAFLSVALWGTKADLAFQKTLLVSPEGVVNLSYGPRFWADGHDHCLDWHERYQNR